MKRLFLSALAVLMLVAGCGKYDDTDLKNRVGNLENRVSALEELCKQLNTNISSLQTIVIALQENDFITSVTEIKSGGEVIGYTITFSKSEPVTIYHGKNGDKGDKGDQGDKGDKGDKGEDGYTPQIGVKQDADGHYYWILDGEWLTDTDGNKISAEGKPGENGDGNDGRDGITPQLKIEDGYWYISYDEGQSWQQLGKATGENGADGKDGTNGVDGINGDSIFSDVDTSNPDYVIFTLSDGTQIQVPRSSQLAIKFDKESPISMLPNSTCEIGYTVTGNTADLYIEVVTSGDVKAKVNNPNEAEGTLTIIAGADLDEFTRVVVLVSNGEKTIMSSLSFEDAGPVAIPDNMEAAFPDAIFRDYLLKNFDTDGDGRISQSEADDIETIDVNISTFSKDELKIASLEGIQYFSNLKELYCNGNKITKLKLSKNTALTTLTCANNLLTALDLSNNTKLVRLEFGTNQLTALDITRNTALERLDCISNQLTELDVTQNTALGYLRCATNKLTALDVTNNTALKELYCGQNQFTHLDVTKNTELTLLSCAAGVLTELDVTHNEKLETLYCNSNALTGLDLSHNAALISLWCYSNNLTTLDVSQTALGTSSVSNPLDCAPMATLQTLILKTGWKIKGINLNRSSSYIPATTQIEYAE